ncbi:hypothetical protein FOXYSP1_00867 [Fusarium oxysporum f. sp. phaseoli]
MAPRPLSWHIFRIYLQSPAACIKKARIHLEPSGFSDPGMRREMPQVHHRCCAKSSAGV